MHQEYLNKLTDCINNTCIRRQSEEAYASYEDGIEALVDVFSKTKRCCRQVFFIGNGGSAAIASHMTADFMKNGGMKTYSLYDNSVTTCMGNDYGYEYIFSRPLEFLMNNGDLLVAISSSGNSKSIINAIGIAKEKNANIITLSGFKPDNAISKMGNYNVYVGIEHYGIVESIHNLILQQIVDVILDRDGVTL